MIIPVYNTQSEDVLDSPVEMNKEVHPESDTGSFAAEDPSLFKSIIVNDIDNGREAKSNAISTTKYTWYTWLPKSLWDQFRRIANAYFLFISILMMIGTYATYLYASPLDPYSTVGTLIVVLLITSVRELIEDLARGKSDKFENNRKVTIVTFDDDGKEVLTVKKSKYVKPGDIIKMTGQTPCPVDLLLILTSFHDDGNKCFVETANIDGETNLKVREAPGMLVDNFPESIKAGTAVPGLFKGNITFEVPNKNIHNFVGTLRLNASSEAIPLGASNIVLRSALFSNTDWGYGIAIYTGQETKIQMNNRHAPSKMSRLEENLNRAIFIIFVSQVVLVTISVISIYAMGFSRESKLPYVFPTYGGSGGNSILPLWLEQWFVFFLLYNNFIPISLYVTIELVNLGQAFLIGSDEKIYHPELNVPCTVRASNLCQELGMVSNIFSDKTGTLTRNEMKLVKFVVNGRIHDVEFTTPPQQQQAQRGSSPRAAGSPPGSVLGSNRTVAGETISGAESTKDATLLSAVAPEGVAAASAAAASASASAPPFSATPPLSDNNSGRSAGTTAPLPSKHPDLEAVGRVLSNSDRDWSMTGAEYMQRFGSDKDAFFEFFRCLAACHTVVREKSGAYRAESPDELALVEGAGNYRCRLVERGSKVMRVDIFGDPINYEVLAVNPFNSDRKRMSVLIKDVKSGEYLLLCKGADNIMVPLCNASIAEQKSVDDSLMDLANMGLRTLVIAQKRISAAEAEAWLTKYKAATVSTVNRDENIAAVGKELEVGMKLLGITAIEDRLQDEVPEVIADLTRAGIVVWMLTGDKLETAINIGHSCNLLLNDTKLHKIVKKNSAEEFLEALRTEHAAITAHSAGAGDSEGASSKNAALVIDGPSFTFFDESSAEQRAMLLEIGCRSRSVIACRLTPTQKKELVNLVKVETKPQATCLGIGDGANDVSMILEANVGVGIFGKEGRQAANNADFAIGEFKFLRRLLLVHGRWNYVRQAKVFLYSMHKNMVLTLTLFWYSYFTAVSGTSLYESWVYTSFNFALGLPIIFFGILDRDLSNEFVCAHPEVYSTGRENVALNVKAISIWILNAILYAVVLCLIFYYAMGPTFYDYGVYPAGTVVFVGMVNALQAKVAFFHHQWAWPQILVMAISWVGLIVYLLVASYSLPDYYYVAEWVYGQGVFWMMSYFLVPILVVYIDVLGYYGRLLFAPTAEMLFREVEKKEHFNTAHMLLLRSFLPGGRKRSDSFNSEDTNMQQECLEMKTILKDSHQDSASPSKIKAAAASAAGSRGADTGGSEM